MIVDCLWYKQSDRDHWTTLKWSSAKRKQIPSERRNHAHPLGSSRPPPIAGFQVVFIRNRSHKLPSRSLTRDKGPKVSALQTSNAAESGRAKRTSHRPNKVEQRFDYHQNSPNSEVTEVRNGTQGVSWLVSYTPPAATV